MLKLIGHSWRQASRVRGSRFLGNINVPFQDDLTSASGEDFGLEDFQHYQESEDVRARRLELMGPDPSYDSLSKADLLSNSNNLSSLAQLKEPVVFRSHLTNPYLNLAIEDYIYGKMPARAEGGNYNRLVFYVNTPCVVIGKNQNPWKEVNIPLLKSLHIPLVRRRSGGGTVVHDTGNVNYSFMTSKTDFDRFTFSNLIEKAVNASNPKKRIMVNQRGDIVTEKDELKISGSAYKISRGKSYHHGTMLLSSKLDILRKLLHRDESTLGVVDAKNSISSVKSKVTNLEMDQEKFIALVTDGFQQAYGEAVEEVQKESTPEDPDVFDQNELFGFDQFIQPASVSAQVIEITDSMQLPQEVLDTSKDLQQWSWIYGTTPKFTHEIVNPTLGFKVMFHVDKGAVLEQVVVDILQPSVLSKEKILDSFEYLQLYIKENKLEYTGSNVAGFITNDVISDWVGECIDGTI